jgi:thiamine biosynthesis lipoprotein
VSSGGGRSVALMGTIVAIEVVRPGAGGEPERAAAIERALEWFRRVEATCNRFDPASELRRLSARVGQPVPASPLLFEAVRFALALAEETEGAFDPTVGAALEARGFNRDYRTGRPAGPFAGSPAPSAATFRDVRVDEHNRTLTLLRPLVLDLGAVAKGLAIDLAAQELAPFRDFAIDAGGDLYLGGHNADGRPWSIGLRHPRDPEEITETVEVTDGAVCTSGDYERPALKSADGHHIIDLRTGGSAKDAASVTVLAPSAMVADGLATAAFVLGPKAGIELLERHGADGIILTPALERFATQSMAEHE